MKKIIILLSILILFALGAISASIFYKSKIENINEDIVADEVRLFSLASHSIIPCNKLLNSSEWFQESSEEYDVFWKLYADQTMVAKLIVDKHFASVVETFNNSCPLD